MKRTLFWLLFLPFVAPAQKVKVNEYDKFIRQRRIEMQPVTIFASPSANISLTYHCLGSTFYVLLSGFGWGVSSISAGSELIFLLANDSTVTVRSTGVQMYEVASPNNTFKHRYFISLPELEALSRSPVVGVRKYSVQDFSDMKVAPPLAGQVQKLSARFIEELKTGRVLLPLVEVDIKDVGSHVGDSVRLCSKVFSSRFFDSSLSRPAFLNVGAHYPDQLLTAVIPEEDRPRFNNAPEALYDNKDVCLSGVVQLINNKLQMRVRSRAQITVKSPIALAEVPQYMGDTVTVYGPVAASRYVADVEGAPMLLYLGERAPNQQLTVVMEGAERQKENFYAGKEIQVTGTLTGVKGRAQLLVHAPGALEVLRDAIAPPAPVAVVQKSEEPVQNATLIVSKRAEFPGGFLGWQEFIHKNLQVPDELEAGQKKTVIARVVITEEGSLRVEELVQSAGRTFDSEVLRVLKKAPRWSPEVQNGVTMPVTLLVPITFERLVPQ